MAQQTSITFIDDLDGSKAAETVQFALDGVRYEIDLSSRNAKSIRKALAEFVAVGRRVEPRAVATSSPRSISKQSRPRTAAPRTDKAELAAIRAWAAENNVPVAARGRIATNVRAQYEAAISAAQAS